MECVLFQPIGNQQMIYSELGPTVSGKNNSVTSNFVLGTDDRIEYAELDHRHGHAPASADTAKTTTTSLAISDCEAGIFGKLLQYHLQLWPLDRCFDYGIIMITQAFHKPQMSEKIPLPLLHYHPSIQ